MKKIYFIIVSAIEIILCLTMIIFSKGVATTLVASLNDSLEMINEIENGYRIKTNENDNKEEPAVFLEELFKTDDEELINSLFDTSDESYLIGYYQRYIIATSIAIIIMSTVTIIMAKNNHILRNKKRVIAYSIITFLFGCNVIINIIGFVNFIIILCLKRTEEDDYPVPKGKITPIERTYNSKKEIILGLLAIVTYVLLYVVVRKVTDFLFPNLLQNNNFDVLFDVVIDLIVLAIILTIFREELLNGIKAIKAEFTYYRRFIRRRLIITVLITMVANIIRLVLTSHTTSENQLSLFELPFWYLAPVAVIWAPIVEECVFRGALKRLIPNKYVFIILSGVIFGVLHAISESNIYDIIITAIPYSIMGISFAMTYEKSNNIVTNIIMHSINNFVAIAALFILMGW